MAVLTRQQPPAPVGPKARRRLERRRGASAGMARSRRRAEAPGRLPHHGAPQHRDQAARKPTQEHLGEVIFAAAKIMIESFYRISDN
jgi:hypothetical protein